MTCCTAWRCSMPWSNPRAQKRWSKSRNNGPIPTCHMLNIGLRDPRTQRLTNPRVNGCNRVHRPAFCMVARSGTHPLKSTIIRTGLEALYFSGAHRLMQPFCAGVGSILMLHHVRPPRDAEFQPNRLLEVTPAFL